MSRVFKYPLPVFDIAEILMPVGAEVLCVQVQNELPCLWAAVEPEREHETRRFRVAGTGHDLGSVGGYIGSFQLVGGAFVGHVFEAGPS